MNLLVILQFEYPLQSSSLIMLTFVNYASVDIGTTCFINTPQYGYCLIQLLVVLSYIKDELEGYSHQNNCERDNHLYREEHNLGSEEVGSKVPISIKCLGYIEWNDLSFSVELKRFVPDISSKRYFAVDLGCQNPYFFHHCSAAVGV